MNTHFPDKSFSVGGKTFCGMNPISSQIIAYFMMSASFTNDRILAISLSRTSPFGQPSPKKLNRGLPVGASHILWEGTAVYFRVFVFGRCQKSNKLEAAPEVGPFAKIHYFCVSSPLGWLLWRDHDALLPTLFHPFVPPLCPKFCRGSVGMHSFKLCIPNPCPSATYPLTRLKKDPPNRHQPDDLNPENPQKSCKSCFRQHPPKNLLRSPPQGNCIKLEKTS